MKIALIVVSVLLGIAILALIVAGIFIGGVLSVLAGFFEGFWKR